MKIRPVILCGGAGTRLWPLSREQHPKQMLALDGKRSLLQSTALRLDSGTLPAGWKLAPPLVVGREDSRFVTAEQLRQAGVAADCIVLEPVGRNTAPALTVAALVALQEEGVDPVLVAMPADHMMLRPERFRAAVLKAVPLAMQDVVVTFGIVPASPEAGYGYIHRGEPLMTATPAAAIAGFVEKPDAATARRFVESGEYYWNSGIFVVRASVWIAQVARLRADILAACRVAVADSTRDRDFVRLGQSFAECPADSIDYAVMEKLPAGGGATGIVLPLDAGWSDIGAWGALWQVGGKDGDGNVLAGDVIALATHNTLVRAESRLVACVGLEDAIVVETPDAVLVAHRGSLDRMRELVARLKREARPECDAHRKVFRPWGCFDSIDAGQRFQVKRIVVKPGASLSLQMHHHRAEHWIVVAGTARVTRGSEEFLLSENESTYIPLGTPHRLENPGRVPLEIIEVQSGAYLGEDDIVRFQDNYGREVGNAKVVPLAAAQASTAQAS